MTRNIIIAAALIVALAVALGIYFVGGDGEPTEQARTETQAPAGESDAGESPEEAEASAPSAPDAVPETPSEDEPRQQAAEAEAEADRDGEEANAETSKPSFDVVRVERTGDAVIAGRAAPGSRVVVRKDGKTLGEAEADQRGEWVVITPEPMQPGSYRLDLEATAPNGEKLLSDNEVVIVVPGKPQVAGTANSDRAGTQGGAGADAASAASTSAEDGSGAQEGAQQEALAVIVPRESGQASRVLQAPEGAGVSDRDLVLQAVDYDENGRIVISGAATPGARIVVSLDDSAIGEGRANAEGRWEIRPAEVVSPGLHRLRVEQFDDSGEVVARIEVPFARAQFAEESGESRFVVVQPGNSLWLIARSAYGKGMQYTAIYQANIDQIDDPDLIYPGQIFLVPKN
jgi:nucleoid-associated protein YgaU